MDYQLQNLLDFLFQMLINFYYSPFVLLVKILLGIYLAVLLVDIVLLLILRDVGWHLRVGLKGMDLPLVKKSKMQKRWEKVKTRLKSGNVSQYKVAIIEADAIADEILAGIGYAGSNMTERLEGIDKAHIDDHLESLKGVHQIRNRIVHEADFEVTENLAVSVVEVYENFLKYLEFLD